MAKENNGKVTGYFQNCETQNSTKTISYLCGDSVEVIEKKGRNVIPEAEKEPLWKRLSGEVQGSNHHHIACGAGTVAWSVRI